MPGPLDGSDGPFLSGPWLASQPCIGLPPSIFVLLVFVYYCTSFLQYGWNSISWVHFSWLWVLPNIRNPMRKETDDRVPRPVAHCDTSGSSGACLVTIQPKKVAGKEITMPVNQGSLPQPPITIEMTWDLYLNGFPVEFYEIWLVIP